MIRFFLWTGVASALSSTILFPLAWRAVLVGWAIAWAVHWTEREWARAEFAGHSRAGTFLVCGVLAGLTGGMAIVALTYILQWLDLLPRLEFWLSLRLNFATCLTVPIATTLYVLGIGWCHLNRNRTLAWIIMLLTLAAASWIRWIGIELDYDFSRITKEFSHSIGATVYLFCLGSLPFAMLWLAAARESVVSNHCGGN